jgi:hypothetical protein
MGHQRLGKLPATRKWNAVVALIAGGAHAAEVAAAAAGAAEASLSRAADDPALRHAFYLLARVPLAAREPSFGAALRELGLDVGGAPTLVDIGTAMVAAVDRVGRSGGRRTDLGEMATLTAGESLMALAGRAGPGLFGPSHAAEEALEGLRSLSTERGFALLARDFFARLTRRCLDYFLSRVLADHVGVARRFASIKDHHQFEVALARHCREVSLIVEEFAGGWHGKAEFEGGITPTKAGGFVHVAFGKVRRELRIRSEAAGRA